MRERGFTLIELLVVLTIIGLLLALAPPAFQRLVPGVSTKAAARELGAALREARSNAINENREVQVAIQDDIAGYQLDNQGGFNTLENVTIVLATGDAAPTDETLGLIRFFPNGSSTGADITVSGGPYEYRVTVDWLTGRVEITK